MKQCKKCGFFLHNNKCPKCSVKLVIPDLNCKRCGNKLSLKNIIEFKESLINGQKFIPNFICKKCYPDK